MSFVCRKTSSRGRKSFEQNKTKELYCPEFKLLLRKKGLCRLQRRTTVMLVIAFCFCTSCVVCLAAIFNHKYIKLSFYRFFCLKHFFMFRNKFPASYFRLKNLSQSLKKKLEDENPRETFFHFHQDIDTAGLPSSNASPINMSIWFSLLRPITAHAMRLWIVFKYLHLHKKRLITACDIKVFSS